MSHKIKIIISIISVFAVILAFFILPKVIPYTPPSPNIVKTDQGSFELKLDQKLNFTLIGYWEYENQAKDYYSRISKVFKDKNLIINSNVYNPSEGISLGHLDFWIVLNNKILFKSRYFRNFIDNKIQYQFYGFEFDENDV